MSLGYLLKNKMAGKVVLLTLALSVCKIQSQSIGSCSQCSPSPNFNGLKASPQLQLAQGQGCNLQAVPLSQYFSQSPGLQGSNLQKAQSAISVPKQSIQVSSIPQISSSTAQRTQPSCAQCNQPIKTQVISAPVSTITIPPTACTTIIDNSLSNSLANALQMMIANDFINSAISNNIINQDCATIPVVETSVPTYDLSSFIKNLNANQLSGCECQTVVYEPVAKDGYDWEKLLSYLDGEKKKPEPVICEPCDNRVDAFLKYLKEKGQTVDQITKPVAVQTTQSYTPVFSQGDDNNILQAITAYLGGNNYDSCRGGNVAEVVFPEEIPAQLICNYGYMPTTVPVVSFSVQPLGDSNCNYNIVGSQAC